MTTTGGGPELPKGGPPLQPAQLGEGQSANPVSSEPWWRRRGLAFRRFLTGESKVDYLAEEVALGWKSADPSVRDLFILLAAKWQASREESKRAGLIAAISFLSGIGTLIVAIYVLWVGRKTSTTLVEHLILESPKEGAPTPDHSLMWQALVITSGAVLLLVTVATLLFKVADRYAHLSREHASDGDATRRVEAGIRIAMAFGKVPAVGNADKQADAAFKTAENFNAVALKLLEPAPDKKLVPFDLSTLPDAVKELAEAIGAAKKALQGAEEKGK